MKDVIVDETMGDMDKDNTGFISVEEYIGEPRPSLVATPIAGSHAHRVLPMYIFCCTDILIKHTWGIVLYHHVWATLITHTCI